MHTDTMWPNSSHLKRTCSQSQQTAQTIFILPIASSLNAASSGKLIVVRMPPNVLLKSPIADFCKKCGTSSFYKASQVSFSVITLSMPLHCITISFVLIQNCASSLNFYTCRGNDQYPCRKISLALALNPLFRYV